MHRRDLLAYLLYCVQAMPEGGAAGGESADSAVPRRSQTVWALLCFIHNSHQPLHSFLHRPLHWGRPQSLANMLSTPTQLLYLWSRCLSFKCPFFCYGTINTMNGPCFQGNQSWCFLFALWHVAKFQLCFEFMLLVPWNCKQEQGSLWLIGHFPALCWHALPPESCNMIIS